jgi:plastocyanin
MSRSRLPALSALLLAFSLAGCGGDSAQTASAESASATPLTGVVVEIKMVSTPSGGELFEPSTVTVNPGDVIRWTLVSGVHNASFPAKKNPGGVTLPRSTPYLQAVGQTHDMVVNLPAGEYTFQCDPHVAMGMVGTLIVQ